jgi:3-hydroxyacyl-[acyl-carrier-protein] dehydratase
MIDRIFEVGHPATRGHFPGNPIVPGALLLSEALEAIARELPGAGPLQVKSAKFLRPVRPGERVVIRYDRAANGDIRFYGDVDGRQVVSGQASCAASPTAK